MSTQKRSGAGTLRKPNAKRHESDPREELERKRDGERIHELRDALNLSQEAFAKECGVSRISALYWEKGKSSPAAQNWRQMALLAREVSPSTAVWFLEKAGYDLKILRSFIPAFEKSFGEAVQRMEEMASEPGGDLTRVPLLRNPADLGKASFASPEEVERWISLPSDLISNPCATLAVRVSDLFVRPIFSLGDIVVIDTAQTDVFKLEGALMAALYTPRPDTKRASETVLRGAPASANLRGRWPHLPEGLYLGWIKRNSDGVHSHIVQGVNICSAKQADVETTLEFEVPVAHFDVSPEHPAGGELAMDEESRLLGRVICWISAPETTGSSSIGSSSKKSRAQKPGKK